MTGYPERIEFSLADGQEPFAIGNYTLSPTSFYVGDFNSLSIGRPILEPMVAVQRAADKRVKLVIVGRQV